jgi:hypothetical protein
MRLPASLPSPNTGAYATPAARFRSLMRRAGARIEGTPHERAALVRLCRRPEIRPLANEVRLRVRADLEAPFRVTSGRFVDIARDALIHPALSALYLRHALEIAFWHRSAATAAAPAERLAHALLGAHVALVYLETMPRREREAVLRAAPDWLASLASEMTRHGDDVAGSGAKVAALAGQALHLLPLQGDDGADSTVDASTVERGCALAEAALPFAVPTEYGLNLGGDSRLLVDPDTRLNGYGCSPSPRPWAITFCSCTASSTSDLGYDEAERARQAMLARALASQALVDTFGEAMERARVELGAFLGLDAVPGAEIVFCSSGTDCELFALEFALATQPRPVVNVLVAPDEIGSGSMPAARGLHFDRMAPLGGKFEPGACVNGIPSDRVRVVTLGLRDAEGDLLPLDGIDRQVEAACTDALANGQAVLLHLLDSSKTGVRAPSTASVRRLRAASPSSLFVVVDAAQMRIDNAGIAAYLEQGFMVMISGSKFYTGSPFSGALLVPPELARAIDDLPGLPHGFADYTSRFEIPPRWERLRAGLDPRPNVGLLLRWRTALWEMQAYEAVARDDRYRFFEAFASRFHAAIAQHPHVELLDAPVGDRREDAAGARAWDTLQTIFTFLVHRSDEATGERTPLSYDDARLVYFRLNEDISAALPDAAPGDARALAGKCCHIGQPVRIRRAGGALLGALRIAVGARFVSRVAFDPTLGRDVESRIAAQIDDVHVVLRKIRLILDHWQALRR